MVFVVAEVVVEVADGAVAEDVFEVLEEVGCMLVASVPGAINLLLPMRRGQITIQPHPVSDPFY